MWSRRFSKAPRTGASSWEDAKMAIQETGNWIKNADTKATVVAAVLGVSLTLLGGQSAQILKALGSENGILSKVLVVALVGVAVFSIATLFFVTSALRPRTPRSSGLNRFSWPAMAGRDSAPKSFEPETCAEEAWEQAYLLSRIAQIKYKRFGWAINSFLCLTLSVLVVLLVSAVLGSSGS